jgi:hypothetical protein
VAGKGGKFREGNESKHNMYGALHMLYVQAAANGLVEEYHAVRDLEEALAVLASLRTKGADMGEVIRGAVESGACGKISETWFLPSI